MKMMEWNQFTKNIGYGVKMDNEKRLADYMKQKNTTNKDALSFRQKRRIRKHERKVA